MIHNFLISDFIALSAEFLQNRDSRHHSYIGRKNVTTNGCTMQSEYSRLPVRGIKLSRNASYERFLSAGVLSVQLETLLVLVV